VNRAHLGTDPSATLCACGLAAEAKIARAVGFSVVIGAGDRDRTAALVAKAAAQTDCLVSFGIAGGLEPGLVAGTVIVSGEVVSEGHQWAVESQYMQRLNDFAHSIGAIWGPVLGATSVLATRTEKKHAWATTRALAVDLESEIVARTATALGIPFIVLRSIADTAQRDLPPASLVPLSADGKSDLLGVLAAVLRRPSQVGSLIGLAKETETALSALIGPARALRSFVVAV
jgi:adenosylhomocysteine nucleosidase